MKVKRKKVYSVKSNKRNKGNEAVVIGILGHKGGTGKTFLSKHLITLLSNLEYKVLGIDFDKQGDLMKWASGYEWNGENFLTVNGYDLLYETNVLDLSPFINEYDFIVVDSRPDYEGMGKVLQKVDIAIIPVDGRLSMEGAKDVIEISRYVHNNAKVLLVRNKLKGIDRALNLREKKILESLAAEYQISIHLISIIDSEGVRMAEMNGDNAWEYPGRVGKTVGTALISLANFLSNEYGKGRQLGWGLLYERNKQGIKRN